MSVPDWLANDPRVRYHRHRPASPGDPVAFPDWVGEELRERLAAAGIQQLWRHQAEAATAAWQGRHVALATGTASGKSLGYLLPVITATDQGHLGFPVTTDRLGLARRPTALYLAPTKALAHDQLRAARELGGPDWMALTLDGDSTLEERSRARDRGALLFTNPDMLHKAVLPNHQRWTRLLSSLRFVVIDEAHRYRGVFGSQVAAVLRRLRRLAHHYGTDPVFIATSATVAEPGALLSTLAGVSGVLEVTRDGSARPALDYLLWQDQADPHLDAAALLTALVKEGRQSLVFTSSRVQAELIAQRTQRQVGPKLAVEPYRAGFLPQDRRAVEAGLQSGRIRGVAATNALELGVDIHGVDAVLTCGFPGTRASLWQQAGRAGRAGSDALGMLIARNDPLDAWFCEHPELLFDAPVERTVLHPDNPQVLAAQLAAAAAELPLTPADSNWFGPGMLALLEPLVAAGHLRKRATGWYWVRPQRPVDAINLRDVGAEQVGVVEAGTGRLIGEVPHSAADRTLHPGAVYLHQGEQWQVSEYDPVRGQALVTGFEEGWFTQALSDHQVRIIDETQTRGLGWGQLSLGTVEVTSQVVGYLRRDAHTGQVWDQTPLELPTRKLRTQAVWYTVPDERLAAIPPQDRPGAAHGAEHTAIGLLPGFAPCDRWDIGGLSTVRHDDTEQLTVFVHDGHPGGAGFARRGYQIAEAWLTATRERLLRCPCTDGCPACTVSPKCGSGNQPLHKAQAAALLGLLLPTLTPDRAARHGRWPTPGSVGRESG